MFHSLDHPFRVPFDGSFRVGAAHSSPPEGPANSKKRLKKQIKKLDDLQRMLYAQDRYSLLLIFQAMDAAGKDSTIRAVMRGINPAGCQVFSFKAPSSEELDHDFLWRTAWRLPERGRIGIFNRSYYEEVLVVRVHPEILQAQRLPGRLDEDAIWEERLESIRDHEKHLARNGTVILKFWLNVSKAEQKRRFLSRIERPEKNWKFSARDIKERAFWESYMHAYEAALNGTSRPWAPWYSIPADDKAFMRATVAELIVSSLKSLDLAYPQVSAAAKAEMERLGRNLEEP